MTPGTKIVSAGDFQAELSDHYLETVLCDKHKCNSLKNKKRHVLKVWSTNCIYMLLASSALSCQRTKVLSNYCKLTTSLSNCQKLIIIVLLRVNHGVYEPKTFNQLALARVKSTKWNIFKVNMKDTRITSIASFDFWKDRYAQNLVIKKGLWAYFLCFPFVRT